MVGGGWHGSVVFGRVKRPVQRRVGRAERAGIEHACRENVGFARCRFGPREGHEPKRCADATLHLHVGAFAPRDAVLRARVPKATRLAAQVVVHLGERGPLSQGVQAGRKALRTRHINSMEVRKKVRKKRPSGLK